MRLALLMAMLGLAAGAARAQTPAPVSVTGAWARATAPGQQAGAGYFTVTSKVADRLTGVASPDAKDAMLHRSTSKGGMAGMEDMDGLILQPGRPVRLQPRGMHVMLMGLKHPLVAGGTVEMDLAFEHAGRVVVSAPVLPIGSPGPGG